MGRRIYFTIQPSNIQLFDYLYPDETEDELRERINSKLDIDVEVTDIYFDLEGAGDQRNLFGDSIDGGRRLNDSGANSGVSGDESGGGGGGRSGVTTNRPEPGNNMSSNNYVTTLIRFIFVLIVALVAIWIPFYATHK